MTDFLIAAAVVIVAGMVRGFSGFGAALILAPGLTLVMAPRDAVATTLVLSCATALQLLLPALRQTRWRDVAPMGAAAMAAIPFGTLILTTVDAALIRRAIGAVVLGFSIVMLLGWRYRGRRSLPANLLVGALGGLLTGAAAVGGPPVILYFLSGDRPMAENRAGFISFFALIQVAAMPVFLWQGLVTWDLTERAALLVLIHLAATYAGAKLSGHANERLARQLALGFLVVIGLATVLR